MTRLSSATIAGLPADVARPGYDRREIRNGVVHLGIGAFHRAHQAPVFEDALASGDGRWGIIGASLRSPAVRDQLVPQDGLYTIAVRDAGGESVRVVGAVSDVLVAPEAPAALVRRLADADTHIVTLTITEKGYRLDPASGALLIDDPDVAADCAGAGAPRTAPGFLVAALAERRAAGLKPFTAISCDNLPRNGARLRAAVLAMAGQRDPHLRDWIEREGAFPETMVDRIVPATQPDDIAALATRIGATDAGMVKTEPFTQWVIEDRFAGERPDLAAFGVQLTASVAPWEEAKLRLLNGAHSTIAYLGALAGIETVDAAVAEAPMRALVDALWDEAEATLDPPPGLDVTAYRLALMERFANPALHHRTRQIAMDGSQKLPQRLVATIAARLARGESIDALALGVAAWMRWQEGRDDAGATFTVDDPLADLTAARLVGTVSAADRVAALLSIDAIFPPSLAADPRLVAALTGQLDRLLRHGTRAAIAMRVSG